MKCISPQFKIFVLSAFIFVSLARAPLANAANRVPENIPELATQKTWQALLYYSRDAQVSAVREESWKRFFLHARGGHDPQAELATMLARLESDSEARAQGQPLDDSGDDPQAWPVQCRFPARWLWLKRNIPQWASRIQPEPCQRLQKWLAQVDADSAYLLFAAQFMNSPASMYGHTLLQLGRAGRTRHDPLLDYVVAFGAETQGTSGLPYVVLGLSGGFAARFTTLPLYLKIREYNDAERRDLWSYELKLSPAQLAILVRHVWELREINFPYYFLGQNCSYFLLEFLEVVNSGKRLAADLPAWTIPVDTIRALVAAGWIGERVRRPSRASLLAAIEAQTDADERKQGETLLQAPPEEIAPTLAKMPPEQARAVSNWAYELVRFRMGAHNPSPEEADRERALLLAKKNFLPFAIDAGEAPEQAHLSNRWALSLGWRNFAGSLPAQAFVQGEWRPAIHDFLSNSFGLDPFGEQEILTTRFRIEGQKRPALLLESLDLIRVRALSPLTSWFQRPSWRMRLGWGRTIARPCLDWNCGFARLEGGMGISLRLGEANLLALLAGVEVHGGPGVSRWLAPGFGPELITRLQLGSRLRLGMEGATKYRLSPAWAWWRFAAIEAAWEMSAKHRELRLRGQWEAIAGSYFGSAPGNWEASIGWFQFY